MTDPTLGALLAAAAAQLEGTADVPTGRGIDYYLDDFLFASLAGDVAEFRLRDEVGAAALRTPDTAPSPRGAGWVRFAPKRLDGHARDRALAWFESGWRRADAELSGIADGAMDADEQAAGDEDEDDDPDVVRDAAADLTAGATGDEFGED
jgi:hypothetical protein